MSHYLKSLANAFWVTVKQQLISCKYFVSRKTPRKFFPLNFRLTTEGLSKPSFKNPYPTNLLVNLVKPKTNIVYSTKCFLCTMFV